MMDRSGSDVRANTRLANTRLANTRVANTGTVDRRHGPTLDAHRARMAMIAVAVVFTLFATACGGSSSDSSSGASTTTASADRGGEKLKQLRIHHPDTLAFAAPFTIIGDEGSLDTVADKVTIDTWSTPDVLRSLITSNATDVTAVPSYVGANLFNKGLDVRMAAIVVWGQLYLVAPEGTADGWESLRGQTVMVPFQNDMPDLVFRFLAMKNGLKPGEDFTIEYYATPLEVVQRVAAGKGQWAVLPEHVVTVALGQAEQNGAGVTRFMDLQKEWADATGLSPRIPQAGVIVSKSIADRDDIVGALLTALEGAVAQINAGGESTVALLAESSGLSPQLIASVIPRLNLDVVSGADAREELERFYSELAEFNPEIIGGKLPDADFYLADPR